MLRCTSTTGVRRAAIAVVLAATTVVAGACGGDASPGSGDDTDVAALAGTVATDEPTPVDEPTADADLTKELGDAAKVLDDASCSYGTYELGDVEHVEQSEDLKSPSFPPTSGHHFEDWAPFGEYDEPVPDGNVVHNLEHGGVVVWMGTGVDDATREELSKLLDQDEKWILAPRPDIDGLFSAAWGLGLHCSPESLATLGPEATAESVDAWFEVVESTGSPDEKDVPAYAGAMKEPAPIRDISTEARF